MTVVYLQCTNPECLGLGTRSKARERCKGCGQVVDKKGEVFICKLCGGQMKQIKDHTVWEWLRHQDNGGGQPFYPHDA